MFEGVQAVGLGVPFDEWKALFTSADSDTYHDSLGIFSSVAGKVLPGSDGFSKKPNAAAVTHQFNTPEYVAGTLGRLVRVKVGLVELTSFMCGRERSGAKTFASQPVRPQRGAIQERAGRGCDEATVDGAWDGSVHRDDRQHLRSSSPVELPGTLVTS